MVSLGCLKISFLFLATVLIFFIAGLLSNAPRARRSLGAYRIPWRPAFSSHLVNAVIGKVGPGTDRPQSHEQTYQTKSFGAVAAWRRMGSKSGTCAVRFDNHLIHDTRLDLNRPPAVPGPNMYDYCVNQDLG